MIKDVPPIVIVEASVDVKPNDNDTIIGTNATIAKYVAPNKVTLNNILAN